MAADTPKNQMSFMREAKASQFASSNNDELANKLGTVLGQVIGKEQQNGQKNGQGKVLSDMGKAIQHTKVIQKQTLDILKHQLKVSGHLSEQQSEMTKILLNMDKSNVQIAKYFAGSVSPFKRDDEAKKYKEAITSIPQVLKDQTKEEKKFTEQREEKQTKKRGGLLSMILGGLVAGLKTAAIGGIMGYLLFGQGKYITQVREGVITIGKSIMTGLYNFYKDNKEPIHKVGGIILGAIGNFLKDNWFAILKGIGLFVAIKSSLKMIKSLFVKSMSSLGSILTKKMIGMGEDLYLHSLYFKDKIIGMGEDLYLHWLYFQDKIKSVAKKTLVSAKNGVVSLGRSLKTFAKKSVVAAKSAIKKLGIAVGKFAKVALKSAKTTSVGTLKIGLAIKKMMPIFAIAMKKVAIVLGKLAIKLAPFLLLVGGAALGIRALLGRGKKKEEEHEIGSSSYDIPSPIGGDGPPNVPIRTLEGSKAFGRTIPFSSEKLKKKPSRKPSGIDFGESLRVASPTSIRSQFNGRWHKPYEGDPSIVKYLGFSMVPNLRNVNPDVYHNFLGMTRDFYNRTGLPVQVNSAWRPGNKGPHGAGFAIDIQSPHAEAMEEMGLMQKWGFHRPLLKWKSNHGGKLDEPWHIEPWPGQEVYGSPRNTMNWVEGGGQDWRINTMMQGKSDVSRRETEIGGDTFTNLPQVNIPNRLDSNKPMNVVLSEKDIEKLAYTMTQSFKNALPDTRMSQVTSSLDTSRSI